jgi:transposase-like protein
MARVNGNAKDKSKLVAELPAACSDEVKAVEFMERTRWKGEPWCPRCGSLTVRQMRGRKGNRSERFLWACTDCKRQFTVRIGTVFEDSRIPLRHWCYGFWAACSSKKGVSALQIKRITGLSYRSALFMMHRIRYAMAPTPGGSRPLSGTVEADETYVGGKPRYPNIANRGHRDNKACVVGMIERGGEVRPLHVGGDTGPGVRTALVQHIDRDARLMTDESYLYRTVGKLFRGGHDSVKHSIRQYVRAGDIHTNTIEGFFALLKRGLYGTFHSVSRKHLHRYLAEFQFRYNLRGVDDGERTVEAIRQAFGKRLTYREQVGPNRLKPA